MMIKKKSPRVLEDNTSGVLVGDIELVHVFCFWFFCVFLRTIKLHYIDGFPQSFVLMPLSI